MKTIHVFLTAMILTASGILFAAAPAVPAAGAATVPTVDEIVKKANLMAYYQGLDGKSKVAMTITDKQGRTRTRDFTILRKILRLFP
jgi:hypothetical protein